MRERIRVIIRYWRKIKFGVSENFEMGLLNKGCSACNILFFQQQQQFIVIEKFIIDFRKEDICGFYNARLSSLATSGFSDSSGRWLLMSIFSVISSL